MDRLSAAKERIARIWEGGAAAVGTPISAMDNFLKHVSAPPDSECWIWSGPIQSDGTGQFTWTRRDGKPENSRTHRLMYELLKKREVSQSIPVVQTCGEKLCLRPEHLMERPRKGRKRGSYNKTPN
jgi:hypothetical protein